MKEVVVITGGASGLGLLMAEMFAMKGAKVALLDTQEVKREGEGRGEVRGYRCDVTDRKQVEGAKERIIQDVCYFYYHFTRKLRCILDSMLGLLNVLRAGWRGGGLQ